MNLPVAVEEALLQRYKDLARDYEHSLVSLEGEEERVSRLKEEINQIVNSCIEIKSFVTQSQSHILDDFENMEFAYK